MNELYREFKRQFNPGGRSAKKHDPKRIFKRGNYKGCNKKPLQPFLFDGSQVVWEVLIREYNLFLGLRGLNYPVVFNDKVTVNQFEGLFRTTELITIEYTCFTCIGSVCSCATAEKPWKLGSCRTLLTGHIDH